MTLYNLRSALDDYRITKFDADMNVESSYLITDGSTGPVECECPAGTRPTCRHRQMLRDLITLVDSEFFWDFDKHIATDSDGAQVTLDEIAKALATVNPVLSANSLLDDMPFIQPHSITANAPDFDSGDGGSTPPAVAKPVTSWRRI